MCSPLGFASPMQSRKYSFLSNHFICIRILILILMSIAISAIFQISTHSFEHLLQSIWILTEMEPFFVCSTIKSWS
jgi:hypothetical protein